MDTLSRFGDEIDILQFVRLAEKKDKQNGIKNGFTDAFLSKDIAGQIKLNNNVDVKKFFLFARKVLNLDIDIYNCYRIPDSIARISIANFHEGLSSILLQKNPVKDRLVESITAGVLSDEKEIDLPSHFKDYCISRLRHWIDYAFLAKEMQPGREYIVKDNAIYPVDYKSTGVIETNKRWGDGLQQFLEMKHRLPRSPYSLITNFLSNIEFFERYGSNIFGVSGTLGTNVEKKFMSDIFSVEFATIPTSRRRKLFELDGAILEFEHSCLDALYEKVQSVIASQRAVLVICEDIATADIIHERMSKDVKRASFHTNKYAVNRNEKLDTEESKATLYYSASKIDGYDGGRMNKELKPGDVVIVTNLGARGMDFATDGIVNENGGLFVLVTFIPLNDRVEKQAFGRTGRRGATGSCQIMINRETMPEWSRLCETVDEVKRLRDSIEMRRFVDPTEVNLVRNKQKLFRVYCELKK